jgi:hypothetical protein
MPFAGPETALPATIVARDDLTLIRDEIIRPAARVGPSTTFQSLTPRLNNLRGSLSTTFVILSNAKDLCTLPTASMLATSAEILRPAKNEGLRMTMMAVERLVL